MISLGNDPRAGGCLMAILIISGAALSSCNGSGFGAGSNSGKTSNRDSAESRNRPNGPLSNESGWNDLANQFDGDDDSRDQDDLDEDDRTCLEKKAQRYRFVLVFDASQSMASSDRYYARRQGALDFLDQLNSVVAKSKAIKADVGVVKFATNAANISMGWREVSPSSLFTIQQMIEQATEYQHGGSTNYIAALDQVPGFFAGARNGNTKDYVIFLSDGEPRKGNSNNYWLWPMPGMGDGDNKQALVNEINRKVDMLVANYKVAMITIASGQSISSKGIQILNGMAKPLSGEHRGLFRRAANGTELRSTWKSLLKDITGC